MVFTQRIFSRISWGKNFENWSTFAKVIIKHQRVYFFQTRSTWAFYHKAQVLHTRHQLACSYDQPVTLRHLTTHFYRRVTVHTTLVKMCFPMTNSCRTFCDSHYAVKVCISNFLFRLLSLFVTVRATCCRVTYVYDN